MILMPVAMPADSARSRVTLWLAHQTPWIWIAVILADIPCIVLRRGVVTTTLTILIVIVLGVTMYALRRHMRVMCTRCADAVALDGAQKARDRAALLRLDHRVFLTENRRSRRIRELVPLIVCAALNMVPVLRAMTEVLILVLIAISCAQTYLMFVHCPLQPWCPQCHWDDGRRPRGSPRPRTTRRSVGGDLKRTAHFLLLRPL